MRMRGVGVSLVLLGVCASAWAEQDFYGIRMRNEAWARYMVLQEKSAIYVDDLLEGPILDHVVHAEGSAKPLEEGRLEFRITVFNDAGADLAAGYEDRDFFIVTKSGKKYSLVDTQEDIVSVPARSKATFTPSSGNLVLKNSDIEMIGVSFELGSTYVFLFPWSRKEAVTKLISPPPPAEPIEDGKRGPEFKREKSKSKQDFWSWLSSHKKNKDVKPIGKQPPPVPAPSPMGAAPAGRAPEPAGSESREKLDRAIQNFKYVPSDGDDETPSALGPPVRSNAEVISYDSQYQFLTLNLGQRDGLQPNMTLSVLRDGQLVAKAKVRQVRAAVAAASVLPETARGEVRAGDRIAFG